VEYDVDFQMGIMALMLKDKKFLAYSTAHMKPAYFETKDLKWVFNQIRSFYKNYREPITTRALVRKIKEELSSKKSGFSKDRVESIKYIWKQLQEDETRDRDFIMSEAVSFIQKEAVREAFVKAKELYDSDTLESIPNVFSSALYESTYQHRKGQYYPSVDVLKERVERRKIKVKTCPTGIAELDNYLRFGGLGSKELGVILAPPNRGKSMALKHLAEHNVRIGRKVVIFTLEMSEDRYLDRFDMSLAEVTSKDLMERESYVEEKIKYWESKFEKALHIKEYGSKRATVQTLIAYVENLRNENWYPDLIVVDYADELASSTKFAEERQNLSYIYKNLRGWAVDEELPLWTASQANRSSLAKKIITIGDVAEDFGKAAIADVIAALCQTKAEHEERKMRIFLAKNRDSPAQIEIPITTNYYMGRFYADIAMMEP